MKKILVDKQLMSVLEQEKNVLSRSDMVLFIAETAEEALRAHRNEKVDLIVMDIDIPEMGADKLCAEIRKSPALQKVSIILICFNIRTDIERCNKCGANSYITKPLETGELFRRITEFLNIPERENVRVLMKVTIKGNVKKDSFFSTSQNISASGVLLETDKVLSKGDLITCSFVLRSDHLKVDGEVMRVIKISPTSYQYGIKFITLDKYSKAGIEEFVTSRRNR